MKQNIFFLLVSFVVWTQGFSQTTAYNAPSILQCNYELFDLTVQTPIVLGPQSPTLFSVDYFTSNADAQANTNAITNPSSFGIGGSMYIFARVTNIADQTFDISGFFITVLYPFAPEFPDVTACDMYLLPQLQSGDYFTGPSGTGSPLFPGQPVTATMTVYIYDWIETCSDESSFVVTIMATPTIPPIADVYACEPYELPALPPGMQYFANQAGTVPITSGTVSQSMTVFVVAQSGSTPNCSSSTSFNVTIGTPPFNDNITPLIVCSPESIGFAFFDLTTKNAEITIGIAGFTVTFFETLTDAQANASPIQNPTAYYNIVANAQIVYARVEEPENGCFSVVSVPLLVTPCTNNTISGTITFDGDNNGCTAADSPASNVPVVATNGNLVQYAYTNADGVYTFSNVQEGTNFVSAIPQSGTSAAPVSYTVSVTGTSQDFTANNFCLTAVPNANAGVAIYPMSAAIPGFAVSYSMYIYNYATTTLNGTLTFSFDDDQLNFTAASQAVASQTLGMLTFNYDNLLPYTGQYITVTFMVNPPPTVVSGNILPFTANLTTNVADTNMSNNTFAFNHSVVNSYDPNDITVLEGPYISETQADGYLNYMVRFQNTGTSPAVNIKITNSLDSDLDWSTFEPMAASHLYQAERSDGDVTFRFNNINLPASSANEVLSHGFITYRVKPTASFTEGDIVFNTANIFFDFNAPIITNTVSTQIQTLGIPGAGRNEFVIYPNPASENITIQGISAEVNVQIFDLQGKLILADKPGISNGNASVNVSALQSGMYFVKMTSEGKSATKKLIVK